MRRRLVVGLTLIVLALLPLSTTAASARLQQTFTLTADVTSLTIACLSVDGETTNLLLVASGIVDDTAGLGGTARPTQHIIA